MNPKFPPPRAFRNCTESLNRGHRANSIAAIPARASEQVFGRKLRVMRQGVCEAGNRNDSDAGDLAERKKTGRFAIAKAC